MLQRAPRYHTTLWQADLRFLLPYLNKHSSIFHLPPDNPFFWGGSVGELVAMASSLALHEEHQYLDLIREILDLGERRPDR